MNAEAVRELARECGFELAGVARAEPVAEYAWYREWVDEGFAGKMSYLAGRRAEVRSDPRNLLPSARSIICTGKLYQTPWPHTTQFDDEERGWISRYAWGDDYHDVVRRGLQELDARLRHIDPEMAYWTTAGEFVFVAILSGAASVAAPFVGSILFELTRSYAMQYVPNSWHMVLGAALLLVIMFLPNGLWSLFRRSARAS